MSISSKDAVGLALAAGTVVLLLVHGGDRHDPAPGAVIAPASAGPPAPDGIAGAQPDVVAFINVQLLDDAGESTGEHVVVVRKGVVSEIAGAGSLAIPDDALVVDCGGSAYLVAARDRRSWAEGWQPVAAGSDDDLVLLAVDPRLPSSGPDTVRGRLVDGLWLPASGGPVPADLSAGH